MTAAFSVPDPVPRRRPSPAEWQARIALAACYRLLDHFGFTDLVYNHVTLKVPGQADAYLINPYGLAYDEVTASNLVKIDIDGRILEATPYEINPAGFVIHSAVHAARDDVACVLHTHSDAGVAVSCLEEGFVPMTQGGLQFHGRIAYHDYEGMAVDKEERARLAANLGDRPAMILRNHGLLVVGASVAEAFRRIYYLEQACRIQMAVQRSGRPPRLPAPAVAERTARQWETGAAGIGSESPREWAALLRMLDRKDPSYRA